MYDVIIVGAGPAGSSAALFLKREGFKCILLDRAIFPRDKPCGGAISPRILEKYPFLRTFIDNSNYSLSFYVRKYGDLMPETISSNTVNPVLYSVRRIKFDNDLLNLAKKENIEVMEGIRIAKIENLPEKVILLLISGEKIEGRYLIGADGVNSYVRRHSGLESYWDKNTVALIFMNEVQADPQVIQEYYSEQRTCHLELSWGESHGYGWIFPKSDHINYGFGSVLHDTTSSKILMQFNHFVKDCLQNKRLPSISVSLSHPTTWMVQMGGPMAKFSTGRILLIGDAAGFVHPVSGEGIIYAIWSAQIASDCIKEALRGTITEKQTLEKYENRCWKEFASNLKKMVNIHKLGLREFSLYFKLAKFDPELIKMPQHLIEGDMEFNEIRWKILKRVIWGIIKGNLWKKVKKPQ